MQRLGLNPKDLPRVVALATVFMCVCVSGSGEISYW
jgi:hypothetical protein